MRLQSPVDGELPFNQAIGLGAARAPVHLDARWVHDDVVHTELG